jgi:hypothetical protein
MNFKYCVKNTVYKIVISERVVVEVSASCAPGQEINRPQAHIIGDRQGSPKPNRRPLSHQTSRLLQKCIASIIKDASQIQHLDHWVRVPIVQRN